MSSPLHQRAKRIYAAVLELPAAQRDGYLDRECADDAALRAEVDSLLEFAASPSMVISGELVAEQAAEVDQAATADFTAGDVFADRYRIVSALGRGGMGEVYRADDIRLDVPVALKLVAAGGIGDTDSLINEARLARTVTHPAVCRVYDVGETEGRFFITMEFIEGENLARLLRQIGRMTPERVLDLGIQLCEGLVAAHEAGIIHRDLKPANVMVDKTGRVVITDFGVAASREESGVRLVGTPAYMAPELLRGESEADERSDLYALGLILDEALTGRPAATGSFEELAAARSSRPKSPSTLVTGVDPRLDRLVCDLLAPDPRDRPTSAARALARLQALRGRDRRVDPNDEGHSPALRHLPALVVGAVALLALMPLATFLERPQTPGRDAAEVVDVLPSRTDRSPGLAVLPFRNLGHGGPDAPIVAGIHAEILTELSKISDLRVIARSSVLRLQDDPRSRAELASQLDVDAVAEGSVRRIKDQLRVNVELVDIRSERQLWAETYDRHLTSTNLFAVESDVAMKIAKALDAEMSHEEKTLIERDPETTFEVWEMYQNGLHSALLNTREGYDKSVAYLEGALARDPSFAVAHAALGAVYVMAAVEGWHLEADDYRRANAEARRALKLEPDLGQAHALLCQVKTQHDWAWDAAEQSCKEAIDLMPGDAHGYRSYAMLLGVRCRLPEALETVDMALERDPTSGISQLAAARIYWEARDFEQASTLAAAALRLDPGLGRGYRLLGLTRLFEGATEEGLLFLERHAKRAGRTPLSLSILGYGYGVAGRGGDAGRVRDELQALPDARPADLALVHLGMGNHDKALDALERAVDERSSLMILLGVDPIFDPLRGRPRFEKLLTRVGVEVCTPVARGTDSATAPAG